MTINASITLCYPPPAPPTTYSIHAAHPSPRSPYPHAIIADSALLDIPHANPWLLSGTAAVAPRSRSPRWAAVPILAQDDSGRWASRAQSPQPPPYAREPEVLLLDEDVLERDLATGVVGRCGARGCRRDVGCRECEGASASASSRFVQQLSPLGECAAAAACGDESPRTRFRSGPVLQEQGCLEEEGEGEKEKEVLDEFPSHLQRLKTPTVVVDMKPQQRTGPKIKYIRKRTVPAVERVVNKRRKTASGRFTK